MKTSGIHFCSSLSDFFSLVNYIHINFPPNTLTVQTNKNHMESPESFVTDAMLVSRRVKSQKFKMLCFQNERRYQAGNF